MVKMVLSASQTQADSVSTKSKSNNQGYETVISSLNLFVNEHRLSSQAYDNGKAYYQSVLIPFVKAAILLTEAIENACKKFTETYQAEVDSCDLDSELLEQQINEVQASIDNLERHRQLLSASTLPDLYTDFHFWLSGQMLSNAINTKQELEQKLQKLQDFEASSPAIFTEIASLKEAFNKGKAQADVAWTGGNFKIPASKDLTWTQTVAGKWETREQRKLKELEAKIKEQNLPKTKADIARDYQWSTNHNMYVNNKTGLPSPEVTALYNQLTMAEHAPQKNPQLEFFNEMLRTGKHPLTGKDITDTERTNAHIMIYSLALQPFVGVWALSKVPQSYDTASSTKASVDTSKVGRWMSDDEFNMMTETGKVQMSPNGNRTYVAIPPSKEAFPAAPKGSLYAEFDVDSSSIYPAGKENWGQIPGPGSLIDRLNQKKGLPPIKEMPDALNIKKIGDK